MKKFNYKILAIVVGFVLFLSILGIGMIISPKEPSSTEHSSVMGDGTQDDSETDGKQPSESQDETGTQDDSDDTEGSGDTENSGDIENPKDTETTQDSEKPGNTEDIPGKIEDFTMFFTGDVLLKNNVMGGYKMSGINGLISEYLEQEMLGADMTLINEEFPFSTRGTQAPDKQYTFRIDPKYVKVFQEMGVDVVSLANNHALDYGHEALLDTFATLDEAGIPYVGAGESKTRAEEAIYIEAGGRKIGVLSASRVIPVVSWNIENQQPGLFCTYSSTRLVARIKEIEKECDFVVVYVHWGKERKEYPESYQRQLAKQYIDAGADLVVGSHSHVPQGIEYYKGVPIVYCLGNFIFNPNMVDTYALKATFNQAGQTQLQVIPVGISNAFTQELTGEKALKFYEYLEGISFGVEIDENGIVTEEITTGEPEQ